MKRGQPLRRDTAKAREFVDRGRRAGLSANPEKLRDWQERTRAKAREAEAEAREASERSGGTGAARRRKRKVKVPQGTRARVYARSGGLCVMCVAKSGTRGAKRAVQVHHVLPEQTYPEFAKVEANLVGVCPGCHDEHERWHRRIPRFALPAESIEFAAGAGLAWYIARNYPADLDGTARDQVEVPDLAARPRAGQAGQLAPGASTPASLEER